jgi:hypothetical protein
MNLTKAKGEAVAALLRAMYDHADAHGEDFHKRTAARLAAEHDALHHLPDEAHGMLHEMGIEHKHPGMKNDEEGVHRHVISKAFNPISKPFILEKAWYDSDRKVTYVEGWVSTPDKDLEKDIVEPEAFLDSIEGYFKRRAPLSFNHDMKALPIGHGQRGAVVRDGKILKSAVHPTDPAEFEHFPGVGSGLYARFAVTDPKAADALERGDIGGFSWVGNATEYEKLSDGGRRIRKANPYLESTLAAYPINDKAVLQIAKAYGLEENEDPMEKSFDEMLAEATARLLVEQGRVAQPTAQTEAAPVAKSVTEDKLAEVMAAMLARVEETVQKAMPIERKPGVGRQSTVVEKGSPIDPLEADPVRQLVKKSREGKTLTAREREFANHLFTEVLTQGMTDLPGDINDLFDDELPSEELSGEPEKEFDAPHE